MLPIIVLSRDGEILLFDSVARAERRLEPIDVQNDEYLALDAAGNPLDLVVVRKSASRPGHTRIRSSSTGTQEESWLVRLRETLPRYGLPGAVAGWAGKDELLSLAIRVGEREHR